MPLSNYGINLADSYKNAEAIKAQRRAGTLADINVQNAQTQQQQMATLRNLYSQNTTTDANGQAKINYDAIAQGMASAGAGEQAPAYAEKASAERASAIKEGATGSEVIGRIFGGVVPGDPNSMAMAKQAAAREGVDPKIIAQMPDTITKEEHDRIMQQSMSPKDWETIQANIAKGQRTNLMDLVALRAANVAPGTNISDLTPGAAQKVIAQKAAGRPILVDNTSPTGEKTKVIVPGASVAGGGKVDMGQNLTTQTKQLSDSWKASNIGGAIPAIKYIDNFMSQHPNDLPGIGGLKNINSATYFETPEGKQFRAAVNWLRDNDLKTISGGAVTDNEFVRSQIRMAMSLAHTAEDYRNVYKNLIKPLYVNVFKGMVGGYTPAVQEQFKNNNGPDLSNISQGLDTGNWNVPANKQSAQSAAPLPSGWSVRTK